MMEFFRFSPLMIVRNKFINISVFVFFTLFIFLLSSVIFTSSSLQNSLVKQINTQGDIIISNQKASRWYPISSDLIEEFEQIQGVKKVKEEVFGYYFFNKAQKYINIIGLDFIEEEKTIKALNKNFDLKDFFKQDSMILSSSVKKLFEKYYYTDFFNFISSNSEVYKVYFDKTFPSDYNLFLNDTILVDLQMAKDILGFDENEASQISLSIPNELEIANIVEKLRYNYPNLQIKTKQDMIKEAKDLYDYKGGVFISLYLLCFLGFLVIFYAKYSGNFGQDKKQVGILRSLGWSISDVIKWKMNEAFIISLLSFFNGVILAFIYVYFYENNLFLNIFLGSENISKDLRLNPFFDINSYVILFLITVIPYVFSTLYPTWKSSTIDPIEAIK